MQTTAIRMVAKSLPENEVILLTLLISKRYIHYIDLHKIIGKVRSRGKKRGKTFGVKGKCSTFATAKSINGFKNLILCI